MSNVSLSELNLTVAPKATLSQHRYDIDWLRTLALGLLIVYHVVMSFQPWGYLFGFPQNEQSLVNLWIPMALINVWRIPILFVISGMGVWFALKRRNWQQLLQDRALRILLPFGFGIFFISPIVAYASMIYYDTAPYYLPGLFHLLVPRQYLCLRAAAAAPAGGHEKVAGQCCAALVAAAGAAAGWHRPLCPAAHVGSVAC